jgi:hypothetical protein
LQFTVKRISCIYDSIDLFVCLFVDVNH